MVEGAASGEHVDKPPSRKVYVRCLGAGCAVRTVCASGSRSDENERAVVTTPRERVLAAFDFQEVQPVPYTIWYDHGTMEKLDLHYGGAAWRQAIQDHVLRVTVDWEPRTDLGRGRYSDIHGTIWQKGNPVHVVESPLKKPSLAGFSIPSYAPYVRASRTGESGAHAIIPQLSFDDARKLVVSRRAETLTVVGYGFGVFESAWMLRGYENFFADLIEEPSFARDLLALLTERHLELLDVLLELPCDGIIFSDDYGDQRGVNIGPVLWRAFVKPCVARLYERVHAAKKMTFQHTCGSVFDIVPDLIEIGLDVLQSLQPEAMNVYEIKRRHGRNLRLWGGLGTQRLLPFGTPDEIRAEVRRLKSELGCGGGYVLTSSKPIMDEVPLPNAVAFIEEVLGPGALTAKARP
jgi:uroporphyrinogen decarboxylase